jgi:hypothetical protein
MVKLFVIRDGLDLLVMKKNAIVIVIAMDYVLQVSVTALKVSLEINVNSLNVKIYVIIMELVVMMENVPASLDIKEKLVMNLILHMVKLELMDKLFVSLDILVKHVLIKFA